MQKTILIVEDEVDVRENLQEILSSHSYKVVTATNGREAIKLLGKFVPDLIISDIMMPFVDGLELLAYVQESKTLSSVPFILLTAKTSYQDMRTGMVGGADDYLVKPFKAKDLLETVSIKIKKRARIKDQLNDIKESIAMSIPHEFRTPLTPIIGLSTIIIDDAKDLSREEIEAMNKIIKENAIRLHTRIEKFILLSSLHYELAELSRGNSQLTETANFVKSVIDESAEEELQFNDRVDDAEILLEESAVKMDKYYLKICIKELVENACKFSAPQTKIKIIGKSKEDRYELSVENSNKGLSPEQIKNIGLFNKHFDATMVGSGLGLQLVKKITDYFGGGLEIISETEKFVRIIVHIPLVENNI